ncbi:hypothetical protein E_149 [Cronobacter phage vB_CsaM_leE]|uniref:Uncharacterized protein n=3 Tax=Pseudotevenvirus TaxID=2842979 RepID=A0A1W5N1L9_9CAUD|nr:hypothetical protein HWB00_gp151 [Cronobacter phage vB_CsaM_leB]YP_009831444.1 hypothetical protein HWB01_gp148 [Cronobacter phage vB_CsaM_leE]AOG16277.1 hypothetical protein B_151 [Cronobacter phage vB_CsaM_leB]AOG16556.1 hypothetical protein N_151 [Cronobacter phage vB_CsaM_leN]AON97157.1 hypothetical protein E_149 [Cronobacter phage vB_CsaM_leE]
METKLTPEQQLAIVDERIDEIRAVMKPYQEKLNGLLKGRQEIKEEIDKATASRVRAMTPKQRMEFYINSPNSGHEIFRDATKFFQDMGLGIDGYNPETNQHILRIAMNEDRSNLETVLKSLQRVKPYVKPIGGKLLFDIFEHTCSQFSTYWLAFDIAEERWMCFTGWSLKRNQKPEFESDSLRSVLAYICETHYYTPIEEDSY